MPDARRRRTPGRETEKPTPGVNSRMEGGRQKKDDGWQSRISGEKKQLVLLTNQKDYVHIYKSMRFGTAIQN